MQDAAQKSQAPSKPVRQTAPAPREPSPPAREPSHSRREASPPRREPSPPRAPASQPSAIPQGRNLLAQGLPKRQDSDDEQENDEDWGGTYYICHRLNR